MKLFVASTCALALLLAAAPAPADTEATHDDPIALTWSAPAECPSAAELRAAISRRLGGKSAPASGKRLKVRASVSHGKTGRWTLHIRTESEGNAGERDLRADTCAALASAAALIIALAYDPAAVARAAEPPDAAPARPVDEAPPPLTAPATNLPSRANEQAGAPAAPISSPPSSPQPAPSPSIEALLLPPPLPASLPPTPPRAPHDHAPLPARRAVPKSALGALLTTDAGALPSPAFGVTVQIAVLTPRLRVELSGSSWFDQRATLPSRASTGGDFSFISGAALVCPMLFRGRVELGLCGGLELGRMSATGFGVDHPTEDAIPWAAARASGLLLWPVSKAFALRLEAGAAIPFTRPRWVLEQVGLLDQPGPVSARSQLGAEIRF